MIKKLIKVCCLSTLLFSSVALSSTQTSGTITITGAVVEPPCKVIQQNDTVHFSCDHQGNPMVKKFAIGKISQLHNMDNDTRTAVRVYYTGNDKKLALVNISYN